MQKKTNDYRPAIEFLWMAKNTQEAFKIAEEHDEMEVFIPTPSKEEFSIFLQT